MAQAPSAGRGLDSVARSAPATADGLREYAERLEILHEIDLAILSARSPEIIAERALRYIRHLIPCALASLVAIDPQAGEATVLGTAGEGPAVVQAGAHLRLEELGDAATLAKSGVQFLEGARAALAAPPYLRSPRAEAIQTLLRVPLTSREGLVGCLYLTGAGPGSMRSEHVDVAVQVAGQLAVAIENARLFQQVVHARDRLQTLSQRLVQVQEEERRHLARELHDEVGQALTALKLMLEGIGEVPAEAARDRIREGQGLLSDLIGRVRALSMELRPAILDDLGLVPALRWLFQRFATHGQLQVNFQSNGVDSRFPLMVETAAYRIIQEALTNVARHAGVRHADVRLWADAETVTLEVEDQGHGFDVDAALSARGSAGLSGLRERALLLGGEANVESVPGRGTRIAARLPLRDPESGGLEAP